MGTVRAGRALGLAAGAALLGLIGAAVGVAGPAAPAPAPDPVSWQPPKERPAFREALKGPEYQDRFKAALARIDKAALEKSKEPAWGVKVFKVEKDSQAETIGLRVGDYLTAFGRAKVRFTLSFTWMLDRFKAKETEPRKLEWQTAGGEPRSGTIRPEMVGISFGDCWRPEMRYLRGAQRKARWEDQVLVAGTVWERDPDLAETAWFQALAAGYRPDFLSDASGALLALRQERHAQSLDFAHFALAVEPEPEEAPRLWLAVYDAAVASYKLERALEAADKYPGPMAERSTGLKELLAAHRARPEAERLLPPPTEAAAAAGKARNDLLARAKALNGFSAADLQHAKEDGGIHLRTASGYFHPLVFGPEVRDLEVELTFRAKAADKEETRYTRIFAAGVLDRAAEGFQGLANNGMPGGPLAVRIDDHGDVRVLHGTPALSRAIANCPYLGLDFTAEQTLRLIIFGPDCELFLNGRRIFYGPRPSGAVRLVPYFKVVGMDVKVEKLRVAELADAPAAGEPKPGPAPQPAPAGPKVPPPEVF